MSFGQILLVLKARKWLILAIIATLFGGTILVSSLMPARYSATAAVVIDIKSPDPIAGMVLPGLMAPGYIATQLDLIQSERVVQGVIRQLHMTESPQVAQQWRDETGGKGSLETWLAEQLLRSLDIKPSRESSVINISFNGSDPNFAAAMANAFAQNYIQTTLELRTEPAKQYRAMFEDQAKTARSKLEAAQVKLSSYQSDKGLIATDERLDVETLRLNELNSQLVMMQALSAESRGRQAAAATSSDRMQEVLNNPVIATLKTDLARAEGQLRELTSKLGDSHPQVAQAKANINDLRGRIESETQRISSGVTVSNTINQARELQLKAQIDQQRQKLLQLRKQRDEASVLQRDVETAQRNYEAIMARLSQSSLESQSNQTNVSMIKVATPPYKPSGPKTVLNAILALIMGTMLALVTALVLEIRDRRLRTEEDVEEGLGVPMLGILPPVVPAKTPGVVGRLLPFGGGTKEVPRLAGPST